MPLGPHSKGATGLNDVSVAKCIWHEHCINIGPMWNSGAGAATIGGI
jgi:hypothetical protein